MVKDIRLGFVFLSLVLVVIAVFVMAASSSLAPSTAGNGTTIEMLTFNVTNTSADGLATNLTSVTIDVIGSALGNVTNVTLFDGTNTYYNESGLDSVVVSVVATITEDTSYNVSFTISSSATDVLTVGANVTAITNESNVTVTVPPFNSSLATIDSLKPYVEYGVTATASDNLSQSYIFMNISTNDTVSNLDTIILYLYNSTGEQNSSTNSSVGVTSAVQSYNFSGLSDGTYYINATVNDSYNHVNSSLATRAITLYLPQVCYSLLDIILSFNITSALFISRGTC